MTDLHAIAHALGGEIVSGQVLAPGPGHGKRDRSLSVKPSASSPLGFLCHSFAGQDWRECQSYVAERLGLERDAWRGTHRRPAAKAARAAAEPVATPPDDTERTAAAMRLWRAGVDPRGTLVETYLASRDLELGGDIAGEVLRWHAASGAMVGLFRDVHTDESKALSRTFLDRDGHKVGRKFLGPVGGCAVKLDADDEVLGGLHICEGVETGLTARQLGLKPCWALGSAGAISAFPVLSGIQALTLLAEHDDASARAVEACASRWHDAGREVIINEPIGGAKDLNDALAGRKQRNG